jgi:type III restriction enzyme
LTAIRISSWTRFAQWWLFELNARYGWKKFIIVVPSVAIREGVLNAIELTKEHFQSLYGNAPLDYWVYDPMRENGIARLELFPVRSTLTRSNWL